MSNFHPVEVVGRGSETQLQAGEILIKKSLSGKRVLRVVVALVTNANLFINQPL